MTRRHRLERRSHLLENVGHAHRLGRNRDASRFDARQVQDVVDEAQEVLAALEDLIDPLLVPLRSGSFLSRCRSCAKPRIALSGVRSSWLIDERNSLFARAGRLRGRARLAQLLGEANVVGQIPDRS